MEKEKQAELIIRDIENYKDSEHPINEILDSLKEDILEDLKLVNSEVRNSSQA